MKSKLKLDRWEWQEVREYPMKNRRKSKKILRRKYRLLEKRELKYETN